MTEKRSFKRKVRARMSKTGESYTAARSQLITKGDRAPASSRRLAAATDIATDAKLKEATGKGWKAWIRLLDDWGGRERTHTDTARYLMDEHAVPGWWAQTITVGYQRVSGMRLKHQQSDGFAVSASKTIAVPLDVLFAAVTDPRRRKKWLPNSAMRLRTKQPGRSARFDWSDGSTRVVFGFETKGPSKSLVALSHEKLPDPARAEETKLWWRERLADLKAVLER